MKYFKMVSGKGRVPMSESEVSELFSETEKIIETEPGDLEKLEKKVENLSKIIETLSKNDVFKALCSLTERAGENNGAS